MDKRVFYCGGQTEALAFAVKHLQAAGCRFSDKPGSAVTHLLLDVPQKGAVNLSEFSPDVTIVGGNLCADPFAPFSTVDLLQDPLYQAENANITAHCAVKLAHSKLPVILKGCSVLVIGWGRIGKCLAKLLKQMDANVCVAARKEADRAMLEALGYEAVSIQDCCRHDPRIVFNTVPVGIVKESDFPPECLKIELASSPGIIGDTVVDGRRLPGRYAPESSGELIARSILRLLPGGD